MNFDQLKYITAIGEYGSITKASRHLFISQQALSRSIKRLENEVGIDLLERSTDGSTLTREGKIFVESAKQILKIADSLYAYETYAKDADAVNSVVEVICANRPSKYSFNTVILRLSRMFPDTRFKVDNISWDEFLDQLFERPEVLGFCSFTESALNEFKSEASSSDIVFHKIAEDEYGLLCSASSPLASASPVSVHSLQAQPIAALHRHYIEGLVRETYQCSFANLYETSSFHYELDAIREGTVAGFALKSIFREFQNDSSLAVVDLVDPIHVAHQFVYHRAHALTDAERSLFALTEELFSRP